jgi:hypothetical protein
VDPLEVFTVAEWKEHAHAVLSRLGDAHSGSVVVVRSSAVVEDIDPSLPPGFFHSELGVPADDEAALSTAIASVIQSYARHEATWADLSHNEILVQRQVVTPRLAGIADTGAPGGLYLQVEYDDESGRTDTVTAGRKTRRIDLLRNEYTLPKPWARIRDALLEVERILSNPGLLIEFALDSEDWVHVFQAKPRPRSLCKPVDQAACALAHQLLAATYNILERQGAWSDMADWNPAEMLGDRPVPMAASLYQRVVTNAAWLQGRVALGYRAVGPGPLVELLAEKPYVNLRMSFLSLTPASLDSALADRIVEDRIQALQGRPDLHDKVELELLVTTPDVARQDRFRPLGKQGIDVGDMRELNKHLGRLTSAALGQYADYCRADAESTDALVIWCRSARSAVADNDLNGMLLFADQALTRCAHEGVVPFSRQARLAFMAREILGQFVASGVIDQGWLDQWWRQLGTVARDVSNAVRRVASGDITRAQFNEEFGHLRARTYDIRCPRYDQVSELATPARMENGERAPAPPLPRKTAREVSKRLALASIPLGAEQFLTFVSQVFQGRESTKFAFTRVLSDALEAIARAGVLLGVSRDELAYLRLDQLFHGETVKVGAELLRRSAAEGRAKWEAAQNVSLPSVLFSAEDLTAVRHRVGCPSFVTERVVTGDVIVLTDPSPDSRCDIDNKIVAVEAADPGLDWLFAFPIAGLVTQYGGALSHMAVRCAEFGVPAAIGCGERVFSQIVTAGRLSLNCRERSIEFPVK